MDPAFYVLSSGDEATGGSSPNTSISGSSHDTSSAKYHIADISAFAADLNEAAKAAFPNKGRSRYDTVNVSLMRWEQDELGVEPELHRLDQKFQDYGFKTDVWLIPTRDSHLELMSKSIDMLRSADNDRNLFILYYAGHGRINSARQAEWVCGQGPEYASVDWSAIQSLFAKARSDVLILLDTCAAASSTMRSQYGTMEAIVACGFESRAPPPGEHSFTNTLIEVLDDWIDKRTFSASCLHAEIIFQLKLKETKKGREGKKLEWCTTPIHINYTADSKLPGIELCRRNVLPPPSTPPPVPEHERPTTFMDAMDIDFDNSNTAPAPLSNLTDSGEFQTPHVLIKIGLEQNQGPLDMKQCLRWLESVPFLGKWAKIEGVYPSYSTLVILSMPISVWDMLPDHPACTFIGYVTGPNMSPGPSTNEGGMTILISSLPNLSMAQGRRKDEIVQQLQHPLPNRIYPPSSGRRAGRRTSNPPPKSFRHSTPGDIQARGKDIQTPPSSSTESFNPRSNDSNISFPPPPPGPPPIDIRDRDGDRRYRDDRHGRRGTDEELRFTGEFNSPKDGEK